MGSEVKTAGQITGIRYNKVFALIMLTIAIVYLFINQYGIIGFICGLVFAAAGLMALFGGKYFSFDKSGKKVIFFAAVGPLTKAYQYDRIYSENRSVYIEAKGKKQKLPITAFLCDGNDYDQFLKEIGN